MIMVVNASKAEPVTVSQQWDDAALEIRMTMTTTIVTI